MSRRHSRRSSSLSGLRGSSSADDLLGKVGLQRKGASDVVLRRSASEGSLSCAESGSQRWLQRPLSKRASIVDKRSDFNWWRCLWHPRQACDPEKFKPFGQLAVTVDRAVRLLPADISGLSDPYVKLSLNDSQREWQTSTMWGTLAPEWRQRFEVDVYHPMSVLSVKVFDADPEWNMFNLDDDFLGWVDISLGGLPMNEWVGGWFDLHHPNAQHGDAGRIHLQLRLKVKEEVLPYEWIAACMPLPKFRSCKPRKDIDLGEIFLSAIMLSKKCLLWVNELSQWTSAVLQYATPFLFWVASLLMVWKPQLILPTVIAVFGVGALYTEHSRRKPHHGHSNHGDRAATAAMEKSNASNPNDACISRGAQASVSESTAAWFQCAKARARNSIARVTEKTSPGEPQDAGSSQGAAVSKSEGVAAPASSGTWAGSSIASIVQSLRNRVSVLSPRTNSSVAGASPSDVPSSQQPLLQDVQDVVRSSDAPRAKQRKSTKVRFEPDFEDTCGKEDAEAKDDADDAEMASVKKLADKLSAVGAHGLHLGMKKEELDDFKDQMDQVRCGVRVAHELMTTVENIVFQTDYKPWVKAAVAGVVVLLLWLGPWQALLIQMGLTIGATVSFVDNSVIGRLARGYKRQNAELDRRVQVVKTYSEEQIENDDNVVVVAGRHSSIDGRVRELARHRAALLVLDDGESDGQDSVEADEMPVPQTKSMLYKPHAFQAQTFLRPTSCSDCGMWLVGLRLQGFVCEACKRVVCQECERRAPRDCPRELPPGDFQEAHDSDAAIQSPACPYVAATWFPASMPAPLQDAWRAHTFQLPSPSVEAPLFTRVHRCVPTLSGQSQGQEWGSGPRIPQFDCGVLRLSGCMGGGSISSDAVPLSRASDQVVIADGLAGSRRVEPRRLEAADRSQSRVATTFKHTSLGSAAAHGDRGLIVTTDVQDGSDLDVPISV